MIRDNINAGEWDYEQLANEWDAIELQNWGLDVPIWNEDKERGQYKRNWNYLPILWSRILICKNIQNYTLITSDMIPAHSYLVKYVAQRLLIFIILIVGVWVAQKGRYHRKLTSIM